MKVIEPTDPAFEPLWSALLSYHDNPTAFISRSHFEFRAHYLGNKLAERYRAIVEDRGQALCGSCFDLIVEETGQRVLDAVSVPAAIIASKGIDSARYKGAEAMMREQLAGLGARYNANRMIFLDQLVQGGLSPLSLWALSKDASIDVQFMQVIDLERSEDALWSDMSKSCKSRVNWGLKNLTIEVSQDQAAFEHLRRLHILAAGGATRSDETWNIQWRMVKDDEAFLVTAAMGGEVVSASLFQLSADDCYYGVSAADRNLFDKPLGHATLWEAIRHTRNRGRRRFASGRQEWERYRPHLPAVSRKEATIAEFKRSFGGKTVPEMVIDLGITRP